MVDEVKDSLGFTWWKLWTWLWLTVGNLSIFLTAIAYQNLPVGILFVCAITVLCYYSLQLNRWAFIALTVFNINPITYIINGIYVYNRWNHSKVIAASSDDDKKTSGDKSNSSANENRFPIDVQIDRMSRPDATSRDSIFDKELSDAEEEAMYEIAAKELTESTYQKGLWAKCFSEADGEENKAKALYLRRRAEFLKASWLKEMTR
jgi:hypothetical protein